MTPDPDGIPTPQPTDTCHRCTGAVSNDLFAVKYERTSFRSPKGHCIVYKGTMQLKGWNGTEPITLESVGIEQPPPGYKRMQSSWDTNPEGTVCKFVVFDLKYTPKQPEADAPVVVGGGE